MNPYKNALRGAIVAAMCTSVAAVYYGVPEDIRESALTFRGEDMIEILKSVEERYDA